MTDRDDISERRTERESEERTGAPPIEREHETQAGIFEEDERRERERRHGRRDPDAA